MTPQKKIKAVSLMSDGEWAALLVTPSTAMICGCCPVASGTVSIGMLNVVTRRRCRWKHYTLFVNDVFSLVLLKPASWRLWAHINLQPVVPQRFVSTGNKADMKSIQRPTTFKTNCFYKQTANEYFKIINPSLSVALEGFSGVFISTSALQHTSCSVVAAFLKDQEDSVLYWNWQSEEEKRSQILPEF